MRALLPLLLCISLAAPPAYATSADEPSERAPDAGVLLDAGVAGGAALLTPVIGMAIFSVADGTGLLDPLRQASEDETFLGEVLGLGVVLGILILPSAPLAFLGAFTSAWLRGLPLQDAAVRAAFGGGGALLGAATGLALGAALGAVVVVALACQDGVCISDGPVDPLGLAFGVVIGATLGILFGPAIGGCVGGAFGVLAHAMVFGEPADVE